jgi:hypothetical protein
MKRWDLYYWNKHDYCWKWIDIAEGDDAQSAIQWAKQAHSSAVARGDVLRVILNAKVEAK